MNFESGDGGLSHIPRTGKNLSTVCPDFVTNECNFDLLLQRKEMQGSGKMPLATSINNDIVAIVLDWRTSAPLNW